MRSVCTKTIDIWRNEIPMLLPMSLTRTFSKKKKEPPRCSHHIIIYDCLLFVVLTL